MPDASTPRLLPPHYFLMALAAQILLHVLAPGTVLLATPARYAAAGLVVLGVWIASSSSMLFRRRGTAIIPFEESSVLVTEGWFRFSRNPMYLSLLMILAGIAILLGTLTPWLALPAMWLILRYRFIRHEERQLAERFGDGYESYRKAVRRWL